MKKIGVLCGTLTPMTLAHVEMIKEAGETLGLDKVIVVPANNRYYSNKAKKQQIITTIEHRNEMLKLAEQDLKDQFDFEVEFDDYELTKPEFFCETYQTLNYLKNKHNAKIYLICGSDLLFQIPKWGKTAKQLLTQFKFFVFQRDNENLNIEIKNVKILNQNRKNIWVYGKLQKSDFSSTLLRAEANAGKSVITMTLSSIAKYIKEKKVF